MKVFKPNCEGTSTFKPNCEGDPDAIRCICGEMLNMEYSIYHFENGRPRVYDDLYAGYPRANESDGQIVSYQLYYSEIYVPDGAQELVQEIESCITELEQNLVRLDGQPLVYDVPADRTPQASAMYISTHTSALHRRKLIINGSNHRDRNYRFIWNIKLFKPHYMDLNVQRAILYDKYNNYNLGAGRVGIPQDIFNRLYCYARQEIWCEPSILSNPLILEIYLRCVKNPCAPSEFYTKRFIEILCQITSKQNCEENSSTRTEKELQCSLFKTIVSNRNCSRCKNLLYDLNFSDNRSVICIICYARYNCPRGYSSVYVRTTLSHIIEGLQTRAETKELYHAITTHGLTPLQLSNFTCYTVAKKYTLLPTYVVPAAFPLPRDHTIVSCYFVC